MSVLLDKAKKAVEELFSYTAQSPQETIDELEQLKEEIDQCLMCLQEDDGF